MAVLRVAVISGPNLDRLGTREPAIYGTTTLAEIHLLVEEAARCNLVLSVFQNRRWDLDYLTVRRAVQAGGQPAQRRRALRAHGGVRGGNGAVCGEADQGGAAAEVSACG